MILTGDSFHSPAVTTAVSFLPSTGRLWFVLFLVFGGVVALAALWYGVRELRLGYLILRSGTDSVLETTDGGYVELRGVVEPAGDYLEAPFTGTACVACEYAVEEERSTKNGTSWTTIESGSGAVPFRLDDDSGSVLVEPDRCDLRLVSDDRTRVPGGTAPPGRIQEYIDRTDDVDSENETLDLRVIEIRTGADRRYVERRLDVDAPAHVLGTARYDAQAATASGHVNAVVGAAEAARSPSRWIRLRHRLFGNPFVISDRSERRLGLYAAAVGLTVLVGTVALTAWMALKLVPGTFG